MNGDREPHSTVMACSKVHLATGLGAHSSVLVVRSLSDACSWMPARVGIVGVDFQQCPCAAAILAHRSCEPSDRCRGVWGRKSKMRNMRTEARRSFASEGSNSASSQGEASESGGNVMAHRPGWDGLEDAFLDPVHSIFTQLQVSLRLWLKRLAYSMLAAAFALFISTGTARAAGRNSAAPPPASSVAQPSSSVPPVQSTQNDASIDWGRSLPDEEEWPLEEREGLRADLLEHDVRDSQIDKAFETAETSDADEDWSETGGANGSQTGNSGSAEQRIQGDGIAGA